jgi:DNA-binding HxlR family transcriptional regulator
MGRMSTPPPSSPAAAAVAGAAVSDRLSGLAEALSTVGDRWSLLLVASLLDGPRRYGELARAVAGIAPNVLAQRLRHLERAGLVLAQPYSDRPPRYLYELTEPGRELAGALRMLSDWGMRRGSGEERRARHAPCGTPLEARWYCPACEEAVDTPAPGGASAPDGEQLFYA